MVPFRGLAGPAGCPGGADRPVPVSTVGIAVPHETCSHAIFRLAVVNAQGERATVATLFRRWAIVWLPLLPAIAFGFQWLNAGGVTALTAALVLLLAWVGAAVYAVFHPNQGLHDRLADTWVVRR